MKPIAASGPLGENKTKVVKILKEPPRPIGTIVFFIILTKLISPIEARKKIAIDHNDSKI